MPELPEVETTVRGLRPVLAGRVLSRVDLHRENLRRPFPPDLRQRLTGARVTKVDRRAKYGLIHVDGGDVLVFHLGMTGRWRIDPASLGPHDHLILVTDRGQSIALNDARRFGSIDLITDTELSAWPPFAALGPEPFGLMGAALQARLRGRKTTIKQALLDQRVIAGLGNIYVCEALNVARIRPAAIAGGVSRGRLDRLAAAIPEVLVAAIEAGGSSLRDYAQPDGALGYFSKQFRVYGREGERCPCGGGTIARYAEGGRSTWWCPRCQH